MFPKLFFQIFGVFETALQFFIFAEIFIIIRFFLHIFLAISTFCLVKSAKTPYLTAPKLLVLEIKLWTAGAIVADPIDLESFKRS